MGVLKEDLEAIITQRANLIKNAEAGSKEATVETENFVKLYNLYLHENESEAKLAEEEAQRFMNDNQKTEELRVKEEQLEHDKKECKRKNILAWVTAGVSLALGVTSMAISHGEYVQGLDYEKTGNVTSWFFKNRQMKPKIK